MRMRYHQLGRGGSGCTEKPKEKTGQNDLNKIGSHAAQAQRSAREAAAGGWGGQRPRRGGTTAPGAGYWLSGQRGGGRTPPPGSARRWGGGVGSHHCLPTPQGGVNFRFQKPANRFSKAFLPRRRGLVTLAKNGPKKQRIWSKIPKKTSPFWRLWRLVATFSRSPTSPEQGGLEPKTVSPPPPGWVPWPGGTRGWGAP